MTDKLADALKDAKEFIERMPKGIGRGAASPLYMKIVNALDEHEAAKAATPDDVREAIRWAEQLKARTLGGDIAKHCKTLIRVAHQHQADLRQGVTLPREVVDEVKQLLQNCQYIPSGHDEAASALCGYMEQAPALLDQHARGG